MYIREGFSHKYAQAIHVHGFDFGYVVGGTLEMVARSPTDPAFPPRFLACKKPGASDWASRGETAYYPAEYLILQVNGENQELDDGPWYDAEIIISFPVRRRKS